MPLATSRDRKSAETPNVGTRPKRKGRVSKIATTTQRGWLKKKSKAKSAMLSQQTGGENWVRWRAYRVPGRGKTLFGSIKREEERASGCGKRGGKTMVFRCWKRKKLKRINTIVDRPKKGGGQDRVEGRRGPGETVNRLHRAAGQVWGSGRRKGKTKAPFSITTRATGYDDLRT